MLKTSIKLDSLLVKLPSKFSSSAMEILETCNVLEETFRPIERLSPNIESASKKIHICSKIKHIQNISEDLDEMDNDENSITIQKALDSMNKSETKFSSSFMEKDNSLKRETWWLDDKFIKNFIFNPTCDEKTLEKHFKALHKDLIYSSFGLKQPKKEIKRKQVILCEKKGKTKKTLLLDLDCTLIYNCSILDDPEHLLSLSLPEGERMIGINVRPYCNQFLHKISSSYEIFVFTASSSIYAEAIVDLLDPNKLYINGILSREHCLQTKHGSFIKDLRIIMNRDLKDVVIVDDLVHSFAFQLNNGVPILKWCDNKKDCELRFLYRYLMKIKGFDDLREINKKCFHLEELALVPLEKFFKTK